VELVDTDGQGVERITERGLVVKGVEYEVDCIIFATGFEVGTGYARRAGYEIVGRNGETLTEKWADGMKTLHGLQSRGFPNCFILSANQGGFTANFPHLLDESATHLAYIVGHALEQGYKTVEVSKEAEDAWVEMILEKAGGAMGGIGGPGCTPGYYNNEGHPNPRAKQAAPYGGGSIRFFQILEEWRNDGKFDGLEFGS
jgi:cyclohexanone monooxygenase